MFPLGFACDVTELLKSVILGSTDQRFSDYLVKGSWLRSKWQTVTAQWCHDIGHISILTTQCSTHPRLLNIFQPASSADLTDSNIVCLPSLRAAVTNRMFCCVKTDLHFLCTSRNFEIFSQQAIKQSPCLNNSKTILTRPSRQLVFQVQGKKRRKAGEKREWAFRKNVRRSSLAFKKKKKGSSFLMKWFVKNLKL